MSTAEARPKVNRSRSVWERRVLVVGMAKSGQAAARLAHAQGAFVTTTDLRADAPVVDGCKAVHGSHREEDFVSAHVVVVSPGVPVTGNRFLDAARKAGVDVVGELGFAARFLDQPLLCITGTNGKSTTTHLLGQLLEHGGKRPFVGGNLGRPLSEAVGLDHDVLAVEVSSYQLELPGELHPRASVILNLTPDHLGRHGTMDVYGATKARLFAQMGPDDAAVLPPELRHLWGATKAQRLGLGTQPGVSWDDQRMVVDGVLGGGVLDLRTFGLPGRHNRFNLAASVLLAVFGGVRLADMNLAALRPLPHRLELVAERGGSRWVNDSKATNVDSTLVGIEGISAPCIVLLGGRGKEGADYSVLQGPLARFARVVICFGESGPTIAGQLAGLRPIVVDTMRGAVQHARQVARRGETVLLSPACASFDEFNNFEHRGEVFASLVREWTE